VSLTLKFRYRFEAAHRFTSAASPSCQTPHGHTWYATAAFKMTSRDLDQSGMAAEFGALKRAWKEFVTETADHSFMYNHADPLIPFLKNVIPEARLLAFPGDPTTELIAGLFALKLRAMHVNTGITAVTPISVHIQETPTNSITFRFDIGGEVPAWLKQHAVNKEAWWNSPDPKRRA
jgi:6-pyruvoyl-tetrahydropterin synthase